MPRAAPSRARFARRRCAATKGILAFSRTTAWSLDQRIGEN
jgi:hypothetical protein